TRLGTAANTPPSKATPCHRQWQPGRMDRFLLITHRPAGAARLSCQASRPWFAGVTVPFDVEGWIEGTYAHETPAGLAWIGVVNLALMMSSWDRDTERLFGLSKQYVTGQPDHACPDLLPYGSVQCTRCTRVREPAACGSGSRKSQGSGQRAGLNKVAALDC